MKRPFEIGSLLLFSLLILAKPAWAAGPGLEVTGSGLYGLSPSEGPFGRVFLSPQVTQVTPIATVRLIANGDRNEDIGFQYVATLAGEGTAAYGAFATRISFELQAKPQSVTTNFGVVTNGGHSELRANMNLTFNDSGVVTSNSLPAGTPVTLTFSVVNHTTSFISQPEGIAPFNNPYPNGDHSGLTANGYLTVFDENSLAEINGALYLQNHVTTFPFNSAVGHRIDLTAVNSPSATGYAGYIGLVNSGMSVLFYPTVQGMMDSTTQVSVQTPAGVSFTADSGHSYAAATSVSPKAQPDFDRDGHTDYVLFNPVTRATALWYLNGAAFSRASLGPSLPAGWTVVETADFDQNGGPDYLLFHASTRRTAIWLLNNGAFLSSRLGPTLPPGWKLVAAADVNLDGAPDYVLFNPTSRQSAVWFLNGSTLTGGALGPALPPGWTLVDGLDFNANNKPDYLIFNPSTRRTAVWYLNGTAFAGSAFGPTLPLGWNLQGASDFNANGKPDYVLFQGSTRRTAIWYLNGTTIAGGGLGPTLAVGYTLASP